MITKNFRLNALANQFSAAVYNYITATSPGACFMINAGGQPVRVDIVGGVSGVRLLVDRYFLEAVRDNYAQWEDVAIALLDISLNGSELTSHGLEFWRNMVSDMGHAVSDGKGVFNA